VNADSFSVVSRKQPSSPFLAELVAYLNREFGESPEDEGALKERDLLFFATLKFADRVEHIWRFPCASETGGWLRVSDGPGSGSMNWSVNPPLMELT
jgi:hypothetical protein